MNDKDRLFDNLMKVQTPGQYLGNEVNSVHKDHATVDVKWAVAFPDTYAIGMSNLGLRALA